MDFLDRLDYLMRARGINKNILSKESGIPYTTIDGFYKKGYENTKLSTVRKLCAYFGVSMDYLIGSEVSSSSNMHITDIEKQIILAYRQSDEIGKAIVLRSLGLEDAIEKSDAV